MLKKIRPGVIVAFGSVFILATGGVASADPLVHEKLTANGYRLTLSIEYVNIQSVPNMAAAPLVREGFVTAKATFTVNCVKDPAKCKSDEANAMLIAFVQVGCPMRLEGGLGLQPQSSLESGLPGSIAGLLPQGGDVTNIDITPTVSGLGPGSLEVTMKPGYIVDASLGQMAAKAVGPGQAAAAVSVTNRHIVVDQEPEGDLALKGSHLPTCLGPTVSRVRAVGRLTTKRTVETMDIFSDLSSL